MTKPYIASAISAYLNEQTRTQEAAAQKSLTWLRTEQTWSTFVEGLCSEVTEDVKLFDAEMTKLHGDEWLPLDVRMVDCAMLQITTPVIVRRVSFYQETHRFKIQDEDVAGQYPNIRQLPGDYYVEKTAERAGFDVVFDSYKTSSKVESPARDIVQPLITALLKADRLHINSSPCT